MPGRPLLASLAAVMAPIVAALAGCGKTTVLPGTTTRVGVPMPAASAGPVPASPPVVSGAAVATVTRNTTRLGGATPAVDAAAVAETTYPGLTAGTRPTAVTFVDGGDWAAALSASVLMAAPLRAPMLFSTAGAVPAVSASALHDLAPTGSAPLGRAQIVRVGAIATPPGRRTRVIPGADHFATAANIARLAARLNPGAAHQVLIVNADAPAAWAMPAAGLSAQTGAPILLVSAAGVPAATAHALAALGRPTLYLIGPAAAIGDPLASALSSYGTVKRIAGGDPSANAVAAAQYSDGTFGWNLTAPGHGFVFANAGRPLDAAAAAPLSNSGDYGPLLLLDQAGRIPASVSRYLTSVQPAYTSDPHCTPVQGSYNRGWLIGDGHAIPMVVQDELDDRLRIVPSTGSCPVQAVVAP